MVFAVGHKHTERLTRLVEKLERGVQERESQRHLIGRVAVSAGFIAWILRGESLLASFLIAMPAWQHFDPLPVLGGELLTRRKWDRKMREEKDQDIRQFCGLDRVLNSSDHGTHSRNRCL